MQAMDFYANDLAKAGMISNIARIPDPNELLNIWRKTAKGDKNASQGAAWQNWEKIQMARICIYVFDLWNWHRLFAVKYSKMPCKSALSKRRCHSRALRSRPAFRKLQRTR